MNHQEGRQAGRDEVEDVVGPGRHLAELGIPVVFVAHHAVHGVGGLVKKQSRQAQQEGKEHGGHHPVGQVLRHRLNNRPANIFQGQVRGFPAHDHGQDPPGPVQIAPDQGRLHLEALLVQAAGRQAGIKEVGEEDDPAPGRQ